MTDYDTTMIKQDDMETRLEDDAKLELKLWLRLLTCANLIEATVRSRLRERFFITLPRFDLLAQLDRAPAGLTMSQLSDRLMVSNGNITALADRLEQEGLVQRSIDAIDRRSQRVKLTAAGKTAFDAIAPEHEGWIDALLTGLPRHDMADLFKLLGKLKASLQREMVDEHDPPDAVAK